MAKKTTLLVIGIAFLALTNAASAQPPLIALLGQGKVQTHAGRFAAFREKMRELGYIEGRTIRYFYRFANGRHDRLPMLAAELIKQKPAVILTTGTPSTLAARAATKTIPIVMHGANMVRNGIVASIARPGGNITGLSVFPGPNFYCKRMEILIETAPATRRIGVLHVTDNPSHLFFLKLLRSCAAKRGITIISLPLRKVADMLPALSRLKTERGEALMNFGSPLIATGNMQRIRFAIKNRLALLCTRAKWARQGCLVSYGVDFLSLYRQMAVYVDKILKGANPADLPIEQPAKLVLAVNLKTAKALGIRIPRSILLRADEVIE